MGDGEMGGKGKWEGRGREGGGYLGMGWWRSFDFLICAAQNHSNQCRRRESNPRVRTQSDPRISRNLSKRLTSWR